MERRGVPAISRIAWFWTLLITLLTGGLFALGLGIYLSGWVRAKRKKGIALYGYLLLTISLALGLLPESIFPRGVQWDSLSTAASAFVLIVWVGSGLLLRRELRCYYESPDGGNFEISRFWTIILSVYYINYCLWTVRDSA